MDTGAWRARGRGAPGEGEQQSAAPTSLASPPHTVSLEMLGDIFHIAEE